MSNLIKYDSIQTLRALAALMVVIYHSHWAVSWNDGILLQIPLISKFGYLGVQLFFCISGFIVCHVIAKQNYSAKDFLYRRILRIIPLYWMALTFILILGIATNIFDKEIELLGAVGIVKSYLIFPMQGYPLLSPGWSLEHELIFYLLTVFTVSSIGSAGLFLVLIMLWVVGFYWLSWDYHIFSNFQIYFASGILAYWLRSINPKISGLISFLLLYAAYSSKLAFLKIDLRFEDLLFALGFAFLISTFVSLEKNDVVFPRFLVIIGDYSYSLYILHALVFIFFSIIGYRVGVNVEIWRWIAILFAVGVSALSYKHIELKFHHISANRNLTV